MKALHHNSQPSSQQCHLSSAPGPSKVSYARADAIGCLSARLLYESIINSLANWTPQCEDGAVNWGADNGVRWNDTFDGFVHGLHAVHAYLGQGKEKEGDVRLVIVVERAERLIPELMVPLMRLAELVSPSLSLMAQLTFWQARVNLCVVFVSEAPWETIRPPLGASPDPYFFDIPPPTKESRSSRKIFLQYHPLTLHRHSQALDLKVLILPTPQTPLHTLYHYPLRRLLPIHP